MVWLRWMQRNTISQESAHDARVALDEAIKRCPRPPSQDDVGRLIGAYCRLPGNFAGGSLHLVLEDFNWEREHVELCRTYARQRGDVAGEHLADLLLMLTDDQLRAWLGPSGGDGHDEWV